jgi:hypothetical protein
MNRDGCTLAVGGATLIGAAALVAVFGRARLGLWGSTPVAWVAPVSLLAAIGAVALGASVARRARRLASPPVGWATHLFVTLLFSAFFTVPAAWLMIEPLGVFGALLTFPYAWVCGALTVYLLRSARIL